MASLEPERCSVVFYDRVVFGAIYAIVRLTARYGAKIFLDSLTCTAVGANEDLCLRYY